MDALINTSRPVTATLGNVDISYIVTQLECNDKLSSGLAMTASLSANHEISENVIGQPIHITFRLDNSMRHYTGIVTNLSVDGYDQQKSLFFYRIVAVDPLTLLKFSTQRRIFQNITTKEILDEIFKSSNIAKYIDFSLSNNGEKREYCTQIDETDLSFVQRLLACEGWHHHVDHTRGEPVIVITDSNQIFGSIPHSMISWQRRGQHITNWQITASIGTTKINLTDYVQDTGEIIRSGEQKSTGQYYPAALICTLHGRGYQNKKNIRDSGKLYMQSIDCRKKIINATSQISSIAVGKTFQLTDHPIESFNQKYIIISASHTIISDESERQFQYSNNFQCIPASVPFRPEISPRAQIQCLHTATVTGPEGDEIYRDKLGRIKVKFHWDQDVSKNENTSCWLPVSQVVASKGFGFLFLPRVGDQVLVQYIEGNSDNPVVVGALYSKTRDVPFSSTSQSGMKTRSTPQGNSQQGNELRFEDQKDKESILLHAEKDLILEANNDIVTSAGGRVFSNIEKNATLEFKDALVIDIGKTLNTAAKDTITVSSNENIIIESGRDGKIVANDTISLIGKNIEINGSSKIEFKVGTSKIEIGPEGIKLSGSKISITGQATAELKAAIITIDGQGKTDIKGTLVTLDSSAMTQVKAGALVQIQGAITKIN